MVEATCVAPLTFCQASCLHVRMYITTHACAFPYYIGWLVKLKATDPNEYDSLLTPEEYREVLEESD